MSSHGANKRKKAEIGCYSGISVIHWTYTEANALCSKRNREEKRQKGEGITSKKRELLEVRVRSLEEALEKLPEGRLTCARNGGKGSYAKWYVSTGKGRAYLPKTEKELAKKLALRRLYTAQEKQLQQELRLLKEYESVQEESVCLKEIENLISKESPYYDLLKNEIVAGRKNDAYIKMWQEAEYQTNGAHPEHLLHKSLKGERLRSKSEVIIANALYMNHIPYRYECELVLGDAILYPDFTILHPETLEVYYWEHFGMMHQISYRETTWQKLRLFGEHQIFPFHQLITTYESEEISLDSEMIQRVIDMYFST